MEWLKLILASASPRRQELLRFITPAFQVVASDVDESIPPASTPAQAVVELATRKARAVWRDLPGHTVIGSDTVVVLDGEILGKPVDAADAAAMLRKLSGRTHTVYTGVAVIGDHVERLFAEHTDVTFLPLDENKIAAYVASGEPMDKAGAYGIQEKGALLVEGIKGDFYTVMGLPVCKLSQVLEEIQERRVQL